MIHAQVHRTSDNQIGEIKLSITQESIPNFNQLVNRALNCWDNAPKELKDLGDMITHGAITQDHTYKPINTTQNHDFYSPSERVTIEHFIQMAGIDAWLEHVNSGTVHKVLNPRAGD